MANGQGWQSDPERGDQERDWSGSAWTDRVRPAGESGTRRLPDHVPQLQRALSEATADLDAVDDRISTLFERTPAARNPGMTPVAPAPSRRDEDIIELYDEGDVVVDVDDTDEVGAAVPGPKDSAGSDVDAAFAELDAALAAEEPDEPAQADKRRMFRRRPKGTTYAPS